MKTVLKSGVFLFLVPVSGAVFDRSGKIQTNRDQISQGLGRAEPEVHSGLNFERPGIPILDRALGFDVNCVNR